MIVEIKQYSDKPAVQGCYVKTLKRLECDLNKFGANSVIEHINKNYYWWKYEHPKENDKYYDLERKVISNEEAYAAIQQAVIDFSTYLSSNPEKGLTEEEKLKAKRSYWRSMVSGVWRLVIDNNMDLKKFHTFPLKWEGKIIKMGDIEAWGYLPEEKARLVRFCFLKLWGQLYYYIKDPNPNKTLYYVDADMNIIRIDKVYIPGEIINNYTDNDFYEREFGVPVDSSMPDFGDDPLTLREDEI